MDLGAGQVPVRVIGKQVVERRTRVALQDGKASDVAFAVKRRAEVDDRGVGSRIGPLRQIGLAVTGSLALVASLAGGPLWLLVPAIALAGGLSIAWNGLSFTAAAELAGAARSGAAIGFEQTVLFGVGVLASTMFAATVSSGSWAFAFGIAALLPLAARWRSGRSAVTRNTSCARQTEGRLHGARPSATLPEPTGI